MEKYFEEWNGKKFPVREVMLPQALGGFVAKVADFELWNAIEDAYYDGDKTANSIDNDIFYYCDSGFIASDPTDDEIILYIIKDGC